ncbi:MAG: DUF302 domain-containing protein [Sedimenticolaceae bacterium]|nr:DUF302 domain-containing protein [Sedimenticolaceae bacterium]
MKRFTLNLFFSLVITALLSVQAQAMDMVDLPESCEDKGLNIIVCPLDDGIGTDDAIDSMKLRANSLNFKLVAHMPLSEQVKAMGEDANRMEIFQFCDALIAKQMVEYNIVFAGFLPCRIAIIEDADGNGSIVTMNMDTMVNSVELTEDLKKLGLKVRNTIFSIVQAGVEGDL